MISLRAITRVMLTACVLSMGLALACCDDPKIMAMFDGKKKLPGDRKPVFPEGVPGVQAGVPPELMKGYQAPPEEKPAEAAPAPQAQPERAQQASAASGQTEQGKILVGGAASGVAEPPKPKKRVAKPRPQPVAAAPEQQPPVQQQQAAPPAQSATTQGWPTDRFSR